jgi:hypothetical protein
MNMIIINRKQMAFWILMDNILLNNFDKFTNGVKYHYDLVLDKHFRTVDEWCNDDDEDIKHQWWWQWNMKW